MDVASWFRDKYNRHFSKKPLIPGEKMTRLDPFGMPYKIRKKKVSSGVTEKPKRRSPKEIIESESKPENEYAYIKYPGQEMIPVHCASSPGMVFINQYYINELIEKNPRKKYTAIHTHSDEIYPGVKDFYNFFLDKTAKTMVVAVQNPDSGNVQGYTVVRKARRNPILRMIDKIIDARFKGLSSA